jgi:hypothetical protein
MQQFTCELYDVTWDRDRLTFRCRRSVIGLAVLVVGVAACYFGLPVLHSAWAGQVDRQYLAGYLSMALLPAGLLVLLLFIATRWGVAHALDRQMGVFLRGRRTVCRLAEVGGVVLIQELAEEGPTYTVYFELKDGQRLRLTPLLRPFSSKDDAERFGKLLGEFLGVDVLINYGSGGDRS